MSKRKQPREAELNGTRKANPQAPKAPPAAPAPIPDEGRPSKPSRERLAKRPEDELPDDLASRAEPERLESFDVAQAPASAPAAAAETAGSAAAAPAAGASSEAAPAAASGSAAGGAAASGAAAAVGAATSTLGLIGIAGGVALAAGGGGGGGGAAGGGILGGGGQSLLRALSGTVADGYIRGARIFIDENGNGIADPGEDTGVITDAAGNFTLQTSKTGTIIAVGGVNIDTGIANTIALRAPVGATIINPLTTLVQACLDANPQGGLAAAEAAVQAAFGLPNVDLLTYDPLASADPTDATAVAVQQVAAQLASVLMLVAANPNGLSATDAGEALVANLVSAIANATVIDLGDTATLVALLDNGSGGSLTTLATAVIETVTDTIDGAGALGAIAYAQSASLDTVAPGTPGAAPDLLAASDSGRAQDDNITADNTPTLRVAFGTSASDGTAAVVGDTVRLLDGSVVLGSAVLSAADIAAGYVDITLPLLADGSYTVTASLQDAAGNIGQASAALSLAVDTSSPTVAITDNAVSTAAGPVTYTFTFSQAVSGFDASDVQVTGGTKGTLTAVSSSVYTLVVTPVSATQAGTITVDVPAGAAQDFAGNPSAVATQSTQAYDTQGPAVTAVGVPSPGTYGVGDRLTFTVQFNEAAYISGSPKLALAIGSRAVQADYDSGDGTSTLTFKYQVTTSDASNGTISVTGLVGTVADALGNAGTPSLGNIGSLAAVVVDGGTQGSGIDGYLSGVTIFADNNADGQLDSSDSIAITNATGGFKLYGASGPLIMFGGVDISTGLEFNVQYEAPAGYGIINPVSTLVRAVQRADGSLSNDAAYEIVRSAIYGASGGPSASEIGTYDPFRAATASGATNQQMADAVAYQRTAASIATVIDILSEAMVAVGVARNGVPLDSREASVVVFDLLAAAVGGNGFVGGSLGAKLADGAASGFLESLAGSALGGYADSAQLASVVGVLEMAVDAIAAATGTGALAELTEITKVQLVAQGDAAESLAHYLESGDPLDLLSDFAGAVQDASVGIVVPVAFGIAVSGAASVLEGQVGETREVSFTITRSGNTAVATTVGYQVVGGAELSGADFVGGAIPSGSLTFEAGETSKTLFVRVFGNDLRQGDRPFAVQLVDPTGSLQLIEPVAFATQAPPAGGVLEVLHVREGAAVKRGQLIAQFERIKLDASREEAASKAGALRMTLARLQAEMLERDAPSFPKALPQHEIFRANQQALFVQRRKLLQEDLRTLEGLQGLAQQELDMNLPLLSSGDLSRAEVLKLQRQVADLAGQIAAKRNKFFQDVQADIAKAEEELAGMLQIVTQRKQELDLTEVRAPMDGIVRNVRLTTLGGVARPGDELMQIVPVDDRLVVEAKVRPADIGFIRPDLQAAVKLDAYDYTIYGTLKGHTSHVSADTLTEQMGGQEVSYYRVQVTIDRNDLRPRPGESIQLQPGMTAMVEIKTGAKSVWSFITKPIVKTLDEALRER